MAAKSLLGWFYGADDLQAESDRLDAARAELDRGTYDRIAAQRGDNAANLWAEDVARNNATGRLQVDEELNAGFREGWSEGYDNVTGTIGTVINAPFRFAWDAIPKWIWFAAIVGGLLYLAWSFGWLAKFLRAK
jgi:hypothetical protein